MDPKETKCIFIRYPSFQKGYKCYLPRKNGSMFVTMDVTFYEDVPYYSPESKQLPHEEDKGEPILCEEDKGELVPLVQSAPPPSYQGEMRGRQESRTTDART